jgi:hypothetical protein
MGGCNPVNMPDKPESAFVECANEQLIIAVVPDGAASRGDPRTEGRLRDDAPVPYRVN